MLYDHSQICAPELSWQQRTYLSIWEMTQRFTIKITGVEGISEYCTSFAKLADDLSASLYVTAGLYHGGSLIGKPLCTDLIDINANPRWQQWLQFRIQMRDLPRVCRSLLLSRSLWSLC